MAANQTDIKWVLAAPKFEGSWDLVKLSIRVFTQCSWFIFKAAAPFYIPIEILKYYLIGDPENQTMAVFRFDRVVDNLFGILLELVVLYGASQFLKNKTFPSLHSAFRFGFQKWVHLFGQKFIGGLLMLAGLVMLVVPGLYLTLAYSLILPVICFEGSSRANWLERSRTLTLGHRQMILVSSVVLLLIAVVISILLAAILGLPASWLGFPTAGDLISDIVLDILLYVYTVWVLLIYLKVRKDRGPKPKEVWFLKWAR